MPSSSPNDESDSNAACLSHRPVKNCQSAVPADNNCHTGTRKGRFLNSDTKVTNDRHLKYHDGTSKFEDGEMCGAQIESKHDEDSSIVTNEKCIKGILRNRLAKSLSFQTLMLLFSAVIAVMSILFLLSSYTQSQLSKAHVTSLLESLATHGYSARLHRQVVRSHYGSPDLLTLDSRQELAGRLALKNSVKRDVSDEKEDARAKAEEPTFMTIDVSRLRKTVGGEQGQHVVVFDAGSTGTRVHVFRFRCDENGVQLDKEVFRWMKSGLSDYAKTPDEGAARLQPLIDLAMATVPQSLHHSTPVIFLATAGLRLLDTASAEMLLTKVRERLSQTDFNPQEVNILGGTEEGLFGWITINYLLGNLDGSSVPAAALDLGGGSTQLTYKPHHLAEVTGDLGLLELFGQGYDLYTHSYLGQGLKAARNGTLEHAGNGIFIHYCLPVGYSGTFTYESSDYNVRGPAEPSQDKCWQQIGRFLSESGISPPWDLIGNRQHPDIYLFSYFYDVLNWAGVIQDDEMEKVLAVQDYYHAAHRICNSQTPDSSRPFLCQDLTYITRLLGETYMFWDNHLHVVSEIKSKEISWALGAALDALSKLHTD